MHSLLDRLSPRARPGFALAALGSVLLAGAARAQLAGQVPQSLGAGSGTGLTEPMDQAGDRILLASTLTNEIGTIPFGGANFTFVRTFNATMSGSIPDARLAKGAAPANVFFTFPNAAGSRDLNRVSLTGAGQVTLLSLPAGIWQLHEVAPGNTVFFLSNRASLPNIDIVRVDTTTTPTLTTLATLNPAVLGIPGFTVGGIKVTPNGQTLAIETNTGFPFNSPVLTMSAVAPGPAAVSIATSRAAVRWLDNRFMAFIDLIPGTAAVGVIRADTSTTPATLAALTQGSVQVDSSSRLGMSDDGQWLAFVVSQTIGGTVEKVPAAMRVSLGATTDPGGAYIPFGDYRSNPATPALTNWNLIFSTLIRHTPGGAPGFTVQMHFRGRKVFGGTVDTFFADVRDEIAITPRANPGTALTFSAIAPPGGTLWGVLVSAGRISPPTTGLPTFFNQVLISSNQSVFTVPVTPNTLVTVPVTLGTSPLLIGQRLFFQSAWLNGNGSIHLSLASELPVF
jgi:hypothetical protein